VAAVPEGSVAEMPRGPGISPLECVFLFTSPTAFNNAEPTL